MFCRDVGTIREQVLQEWRANLTEDRTCDGPRMEDTGQRTQDGGHRMEDPGWSTQDPVDDGCRPWTED